MQTALILISVLLVVQVIRIRCIAKFGTVFPIPLPVENDDPDFRLCPKESGAYTHSKNCSLFHMCTLGVHSIYACVDGFFYNPNTGKCQQWPVENEINCHQIIKEMTASDIIPLDEPLQDPNTYHRRKSAFSPCTQPGVFPDVLNCALFHYCHPDRRHQIFECPFGLNFDPKIFMCSARQLVNCQYEPPTQIDDAVDIDPTTTTTTTTATTTATDRHEGLYEICQFYAPATRLPVANRYDRFIICHEDGRSSVEECPAGSLYNALTMICEQKPCILDSNLCHNHGQCIDLPSHEQGFKCLCSSKYTGEYCEEYIQPNKTNEDHHLGIDQKSNVSPSDFEKESTADDLDVGDKLTFVKTVKVTDDSLFWRLWNNYQLKNHYRQQDMSRWTAISYKLVTGLMAVTLITSILFSIAMCIWMLFSTPAETVGQWKNLEEEAVKV